MLALAVQAAASTAPGYLFFSPGLGLQFESGLKLGVVADLQVSGVQFDNAKFDIHYDLANQSSLGLRAAIAVVTGVLDNITLGWGKSWGSMITSLELQADGTFGTFRLWPGMGIRFGSFELSVSGDVARSSNWTVYADRLKVSSALRFGRSAFARISYETPYVFDLGLGLTF